MRYAEMIGLSDQQRKESIAEALRKYCERDTLAMVKILEALKKI